MSGTGRRTPMTVKEHEELGLTLAVMRDELIKIQVWIGNNHLPKNHAAVRALALASRRLDKARSELENVMFAEHANFIQSFGDASTSVYYPSQEVRETRQALRQGTAATAGGDAA